MAASIAEINAEIARLTEERNRLIIEETGHNDEYIKSLEWTKNCNARLDTDTLSGAGMFKFKLYIYGENVPKIDLNRNVAIFDEARYTDEIYYTRTFNTNQPSFQTNCVGAMIKLITKIKLKQLDYDNHHRTVLNVAHEKQLSIYNENKG